MHPPPIRRSPASAGRRPSRGRAWVVAVLVLAAVLAGCSDDGGTPDAATPAPGAPAAGDDPIPAEDASTPTLPLPPGFEAPDTRNVSLAPVVGEPPPEPDPEANLLPVQGGDAELRVTVRDRGGRGVEGATVRFERFVGPLKGWVDVDAGDGGVAVLPDARGGRYRVRAWSRPALATTDAQLVFVAADETVDLAVQVEQHDQQVLQGRLSVPTWQVGDVVAFEVLFVQEEVGTDGIVRALPLQAEVTVTPIAGAEVFGEPRAVTDGEGRAFVPVTCLVTGIHQTLVAANGLLTGVELPECTPRAAGDPPPPPPVDEPGPDDEPDTTTTTRPGATTTTTTPPGEIAVGDTFTVPFAGPLLAGTYRPVVDGGDPDDCVTDLQVAFANRWVRQQVTGTLTVARRARDLTPAEGTDACTYRRTR